MLSPLSRWQSTCHKRKGKIVVAGEIEFETALKTVLELEGGVDPLLQFRIWRGWLECDFDVSEFEKSVPGNRHPG